MTTTVTRTPDSPALDFFRTKWSGETVEEAMANATSKLTTGSETVLPINPVAIADRFGARVITRPAGGPRGSGQIEHGILQVRDRRWHVEVPLEQPAERRRFSIAHEIGHILLFDAVAEQPVLVAELRSPEIWRRVERLCNQAAAQILMPSTAVLEAFGSESPLDRPDGLEDLANQFYVSFEAIARRLSEVLPDLSLIIWEYRLDHSRGPAWRTSRSQERAGTPYIPDGLSSKRLSPDVVVAAAHSGYAAAETTRFDSPTIASISQPRAYRNRLSTRLQLELEENKTSSAPKNRVYLFGAINPLK